MTITLFIEPKSLPIFISVVKFLQKLDIDNDYVFTPSDLIFSEAMISNYIWLNIDVEDWVKLKYCIGKLSNKNK